MREDGGGEGGRGGEGGEGADGVGEDESEGDDEDDGDGEELGDDGEIPTGEVGLGRDRGGTGEVRGATEATLEGTGREEGRGAKRGGVGRGEVRGATEARRGGEGWGGELVLGERLHAGHTQAR